MTLVTGFGKVMHIKKNDPIFLWLFGSMGQLGIITDLTVKTIGAKGPAPTVVPVGKVLTVDFKNNGGRYQAKDPAEHLLWLELLVTSAQEKSAHSDLQALQGKYQDALKYMPITTYMINGPSLPPLIFSGSNNIIAIRLWGYKINAEKSVSAFHQLTEDYAKLAKEKKYHRYIQVEEPGSPKIYQDYFDPSVYKQFEKIKSQLDPAFLFNVGSFFPEHHKG